MYVQVLDTSEVTDAKKRRQSKVVVLFCKSSKKCFSVHFIHLFIHHSFIRFTNMNNLTYSLWNYLHRTLKQCEKNPFEIRYDTIEEINVDSKAEYTA